MNPEVLVAGSVGALLVFLLGAWREWRREEKARRGLLQLLLGEIEHNMEVLQLIQETEPRAVAGTRATPEITAFRTEIWQETRIRIAQLAPSELFSDLYRYYSSLEAALSLFRLTSTLDSSARGLVEHIIEDFFKGGQDHERSGQDRLIWYLAMALEAQDQVRDQVAKYLSRS